MSVLISKRLFPFVILAFFAASALIVLTAYPAPGAARVSASATRDVDGDGVSNRCERQGRTNPRKDDSDGDGKSDAYEDSDRDRVDNGNESRQRTSCGRRDSDRDGRPDGAEDADRDRLSNHFEDLTGNDPIDPDTDDDGIKDGRESVGVIESFEGGMLTIGLSNGGLLKAPLAEDVVIRCVSEEDSEGEYDDGDSADDDSQVDRPGEGKQPPPEDGKEPDRKPGAKPLQSSNGGGDNESESDDDEGNDAGDHDKRPEPECGENYLDAGRGVHQAVVEDGEFLKLKLIV